MKERRVLAIATTHHASRDKQTPLTRNMSSQYSNGCGQHLATPTLQERDRKKSAGKGKKNNNSKQKKANNKEHIKENQKKNATT